MQRTQSFHRRKQSGDWDRIFTVGSRESRVGLEKTPILRFLDFVSVVFLSLTSAFFAFSAVKQSPSFPLFASVRSFSSPFVPIRESSVKDSAVLCVLFG